MIFLVLVFVDYEHPPHVSFFALMLAVAVVVRC